jgi:hypothetical protein
MTNGKKHTFSSKFLIVCLALAQSTLMLGQTNRYQTAGFELLDNINSKFYNSSTGLYVESINSTTMAKSAPAFLWPAAHLVRALLWGSMIDSKYDYRLQAYVNKMSWYTNGEGYGCIQNGERFFDDNGLIGDVLMDVYQRKVRTQAVLTKSMFALNYCYKYKDAQWGLPQKESELNKGIFYMGPVDPLSNAYAKYYTLTGDTTYLYVAKTYFKKFNDYTLKLKDPTSLLFVSGSTYANGVWTKPNEGPRACNTSAVIMLGIRLYQITGDKSYLDTSKAMADAVLKRFYKTGGGFGEVSFWGGNYSVEMLCEMFEADRDLKWYNAAKDICDFLIDKSRDLKGYYPDGTDAQGYWNTVRTNTAAPETVGMMSQACAANALLRFAYLDLHMPLAKGIYKITNVGTGKSLSVKATGSTITTADFGDRKTQKWYLDADNAGVYSFRSVENNAVISVKDCTYDNGNTLEVNLAATGDCAKFPFEKTTNGQYKLFQKGGKALDAGTTNLNDDPVFLATPADIASQKWIVERLQPIVTWRTLTQDTTVTTTKGATLSVNASGPDGTINKVEYYVDGALISTSKTAPYTYSWKPKNSGISQVYALAYDNSGNVGASSRIKVLVLCIENGVYTVTNASNNKSMSIIASKTDQNEAEVTIATYLTKDYQQWNVTVDTLGYYTLAPLNTNYNIGIADCATANKTLIKQYSTNTGDCQKFYLIDMGASMFQICPKNTSKSINVGTTATNDVAVFLADQATALSQRWRFATLVTDVSNPLSDKMVEVYPNPATNKLNIRCPHTDAEMEVYTLTGQKVIATNRQQIDVSALSPGVYILTLKYAGTIYKTKFIKE